MPYQVYPHIIVDPDTLHGRPVIEGTQVPASLLIQQVVGGKGIDDVAQENGVSAQDVRAALEYGAYLVDEHPVTSTHGQAAQDSSPIQPAGQEGIVEDEAKRLGLDAATLSPLGRRLLQLRAEAADAGEPFISTWEQLDTELRERRGGYSLDAEE